MNIHRRRLRRPWVSVTAAGVWLLAAGVAFGPRLWSLAVTTTGANQPRAAGQIFQNFQTKQKKGTLPDQVQPRITGRAFLLGDQAEDPGYGLYSYVLLGAEPTTDATRELFTAIIREYLALPEIVQFQGVSKGQLNVTLVPLNQRPAQVEPKTVLEAYRYARAQKLMAKIPNGPHVDGPYIISKDVPLTKIQGQISPPYLYQDLSGIDPRIVVLWVREFVNQSSQRDYWRKRDGPHAALELRTAVASLAAAVDTTGKSAQQWQTILANLLAWKP
ncbi:MAG TPA: hypothetical protein VGG72_11685 [Bryobacteraceae bacterium]|jgi:hypothetical protein